MLCHFGATKWKWRNKLPDRLTDSQTNRWTNEQKYRDAQAGKQAGTCNNDGHYSKLVKNQGFSGGFESNHEGYSGQLVNTQITATHYVKVGTN